VNTHTHTLSLSRYHGQDGARTGFDWLALAINRFERIARANGTGNNSSNQNTAKVIVVAE